MSGPLGFVLPAASIGFGALIVRPKRGFYPAAPEGGGPSRPIVAQAVVEEHHRDDVMITEHPVEQGASIADHAYKMPAEVVILCGWSNSPSGAGSLIGQAVGVGAAIGGPPLGVLASIPATIKAAQSVLSGNSQDQLKEIYQRLLQLQSDRVPFDLFTGKRTYKMMLLRSLAVETDASKENVLWVRAHCRQVLIAETLTVTVPNNGAAMKLPEQTLPVRELGSVSLGPAPAITTDTGTLTGALTDLSTDMSGVQATVDNMTGLQGAMGELPGALGNAQDSLLTALDTLPKPFEVPFVPEVPESFSINLGNADLTGVQEDALNGLKGSLENARGVISDSQRQLPSVADLPSELPGQLSGMKSKIDNALSQLKRVGI